MAGNSLYSRFYALFQLTSLFGSGYARLGLYSMTRFQIISCLLLCAVITGYGQYQKDFSVVVEKSGTKSLKDTTYLINPDFTVTSFSLKLSGDEDLSQTYAIYKQDTFDVRHGEHYNPEKGPKSNLIIFPGPVTEFYFHPGHLHDTIRFSFLNSTYRQPQEPERKKKLQTVDGGCFGFSAVSQTEWREGLPEPDYERIENEVNHVIIHHSAGANNDLNHENTVRNIYLFHTEDNGWSDIGYNYLIAWDGTIYQGRDPDSLDQDNVKGAHFCGANSGTMGVCMLGNFENAKPPNAAIGSLNQLLAWKLGKEMLDPFATFDHPLNNTLGTIAGHRDGCATLCPGAHLYEKLDEVKEMTDDMMNLCNGIPTSVAGQSEDDGILMYPNPVEDVLHVKSKDGEKIERIRMYDVRGRIVLDRKYREEKIRLNIPSSFQGMYSIQAILESNSYMYRVVIR